MFEKAAESKGILLASLDNMNQFTIWMGKKKKKDIQEMALKKFKKVSKRQDVIQFRKIAK